MTRHLPTSPKVMVGMSFASVGSTAPPASELESIVLDHGGEWVRGSIGNGACITHLVSTAAEVSKPAGKRAAKLQVIIDTARPLASSFGSALVAASPLSCSSVSLRALR